MAFPNGPLAGYFKSLCDDGDNRIIQAKVVMIRLDHDSRAQLGSGSRRERNGQQDALDSHGFL